MVLTIFFFTVDGFFSTLQHLHWYSFRIFSKQSTVFLFNYSGHLFLQSPPFILDKLERNLNYYSQQSLLSATHSAKYWQIINIYLWIEGSGVHRHQRELKQTCLDIGWLMRGHSWTPIKQTPGNGVHGPHSWQKLAQFCLVFLLLLVTWCIIPLAINIWKHAKQKVFMCKIF